MTLIRAQMNRTEGNELEKALARSQSEAVNENNVAPSFLSVNFYFYFYFSIGGKLQKLFLSIIYCLDFDSVCFYRTVSHFLLLILLFIFVLFRKFRLQKKLSLLYY